MLPILSLLVLMQEVPATYAAFVSYDGECVFWTGDVGMRADEFRDDLKDRFDTRAKIVIFHKADVPLRCVKDARRMARAAGFRDVAVKIGEPDLGPPKA